MKYGYEIEYGKEIVGDNGDEEYKTKKEAFLDALAFVRYKIRTNEFPDPMRDRIEIGLYELKEDK